MRPHGLAMRKICGQSLQDVIERPWTWPNHHPILSFLALLTIWIHSPLSIWKVKECPEEYWLRVEKGDVVGSIDGM